MSIRSLKRIPVLFVAVSLLVVIACVPQQMPAQPTQGEQAPEEVAGSEEVAAQTPNLQPPARGVTELPAERMSQLADLAVQSEQYLQVRDDGTLALQLDDPAALGVDQAFLDAYKAGLKELNTLVNEGALVINKDLTVEWTKPLPEDKGATSEAPDEVPADAAEPQWGAYPYRRGVTLHFNRREVGRFGTNATSFATTVGAHLDRPHTVPHFTHQFSHDFNRRVFRGNLHDYGTYYYTPWSHYRRGHSYKNVYFYRQDRFGRSYWARDRLYY